MYKFTGAIFLLLLTTMLTAENWFEIAFQTFSKPGNDVTSYDLTNWTNEVEFGGNTFDSICVVAHSEEIDSSTSALIFSRWFVKNDFCGIQSDDYLLQDTVIMEIGTVISRVQFPVNHYTYYMSDGYNFDYLYFCRTKNNQSDLCRIKYLGNGKFSQAEIIITGLHNEFSYSNFRSLLLYTTNQNLILKDLNTGSLDTLDSGVLKNPKFAMPNYLFPDQSVITWEKVETDTVKSFFATNYANRSNWNVRQFYHGEVQNLHFTDNLTCWESGTESDRKTFYCSTSTDINPLEVNVHQMANNTYNFQMVSWYSDYVSYQSGTTANSSIFLDQFFNGRRDSHLDSIQSATNPNLTFVAKLNVMAYAPWTYLKKIDGKYLLQSKMLYLPEAGIEENSNNPQNAILIENYPNPFNNSTRVKFLLPQNGMTTISVYNSSGQFVKNLKREMLSVGIHNLEFKADELNSGLYFVRIENSGLQKVHKILLTK